jgi:2-succinyl-5-enolpyruvyl-6-hydroxy-3-cyclohexene-1-carboxylate synthase
VTSGGLHTVFARIFARALVAAGVRRAVVSPGSRSTPLCLALAAEKELELEVVVDERAAAFVALGHARVTGMPSVLVCTSGTAGAHHHPAILEADRAGIPLITVTADRPVELAQAHASQTVEQTRMFGHHVRVALDLGLPSAASLSSAARVAAQAVATSLSPYPGPVHVNAPFRKPLEPTAEAADPAWAEAAERALARGGPRVHASRARASDDAVEVVVRALECARRPILVAGPRWGVAGRSVTAADDALLAAVSSLSRAAHVPVFAEATSGLFGRGVALDGAALVEAGGLTGALAPDLVMSIGSPPVSPALSALTADAHLVVAPAGFPDPLGVATELVHGDAADLFERVAARVGASPERHAYEERALSLHAAALRARLSAVDGPELSEPFAVRSLATALPAGAVLAVGNSLVVRDLSDFGAGALAGVTVLHQRGVAGIDGLVAGAVGARAATPSGTPVAVVLGDVSALHDVGALTMLPSVDAALVVVVVDNAGGRIFESLPVAELPGSSEAFERLFLTPPPPFLGAVARGLGLRYERVERRDALAEVLVAALAAPCATVVHVVVPPDDGRARRRRALGLAKDALSREGGARG